MRAPSSPSKLHRRTLSTTNIALRSQSSVSGVVHLAASLYFSYLVCDGLCAFFFFERILLTWNSFGTFPSFGLLFSLSRRFFCHQSLFIWVFVRERRDQSQMAVFVLLISYHRGRRIVVFFRAEANPDFDHQSHLDYCLGDRECCDIMAGMRMCSA